ncbi:MAG: alginate export family protein [Methylotenera sp.]|nr:alginate export family protein [Methylotenera sp.]
MKSKTPFKLNLIMACTSLALLSMAQTAMAEDAATDSEYTLLDSIKQGKPLTSFRLRYEEVNQDGYQPANLIGTTTAAPNNLTRNNQLNDAEGVTLRSLIGWQTAPFHNFSFTAQAINVSKFDDDFNDSTNGTLVNGVSNQPNKVQYAKIVDPDDTDVNQLFVDWTGIKNTRVRLGRQQINLDNVRFIGDIGFRQVMQVFDGMTVLNKSVPDTEIYAGHIERVKQITTELRGDGALDIVNVKYRISPTESLVSYAYLSGFSDLGFGRGWFGNAPLAGGGTKNGTLNQNADQGNKIFGARLDGVHKIDDEWKALYTAEYAKQTNYNGGDSRIDAHYYKLGGGAAYGNFTLRADQELLSSNNGNYAFQTPFGTNHLFQGWVDKFLVTPLEGIKDTFLTANYKYGDFLFFADYHVYKSDENFHTVGSGALTNGNKFGTEWNTAVTYNVNKNIMTKLEYGRFTEDDHYALTSANLPGATATTIANANRGRIRDTEKIWLTAMYTF